jgi:2-dehydropantoate 2-reductase
MRVVVVGAGAMGSLYGAFFHDAGEEVWFLEANPATVAAIQADGARIRRRDDRIDIYNIPARTAAQHIPGPADLVLFQVKGFATAAAAEAARPVVGPQTILMTLQNGLGNEERIRAVYPAAPLLIGMSVHTMAQTSPGNYYHSGTRETHLGPAGSGLDAAAAQVAAVLERSGYTVVLQSESEIRREIYGKWVLNCGSLPVLSITGLMTDASNPLETVLQLCDAVTGEACELAALEGYTLDAAERATYNRGLFQTAGGKCSMLQDIEARRRTEIDSINGAALLLADKHAHPAPLNRAMVAMVKGREAAMGIIA